MNFSEIAKLRLTVPELRKRIRKLKLLDLEKADLDYIKSQLLPIGNCYMHKCPIVGIGELVFRAVAWREKPSQKEQLGYPPEHKISSFQRINRPYQPIFYGSVDSISTIAEIAPKNGDRIAISKWRVTKPFYIASFGYTESVFKNLGSARWPQIYWASHNRDPKEIISSENRLVHDFLLSSSLKRYLTVLSSNISYRLQFRSFISIQTKHHSRV